jgi:hypothetical protein
MANAEVRIELDGVSDLARSRNWAASTMSIRDHLEPDCHLPPHRILPLLFGIIVCRTGSDP